MRSIRTLVDEIARTHRTCDPASPDQLQKLISLGMPGDLIEFFSLTDGAFLHSSAGSNFTLADGTSWSWAILSVGGIQSVFDSGWSHELSPIAHKHKCWYQLVDVSNSDYLCISLEENHRSKIIDTFHETLNLPNYNAVVANSFTELLESLLTAKEPYWLKPTENKEYF